MKKLLSLLFVLGLTLSACGTSQTQSTPPAQTSTHSLAPTATKTPIPPTATVTPLPTIPTFTPTFDVSTIVTVTPAEKAECPKENPKARLDKSAFQEYPENSSDDQIQEAVLDFINNGGSAQVANSELQKSNMFGYPYGSITGIDLTNDGINEFVIEIGVNFRIYTCRSNLYESVNSYGSVFDLHGDIGEPASIVEIKDMNLNGISEVVAGRVFCNGRCFDILILEWDGRELKNFISEWSTITSTGEEVKDINNDGVFELVVSGPFPNMLNYDYVNYIPMRGQKDIYAWNGGSFHFSRPKFSPPKYRFQAIQDGDTEAFDGHFDEALLFYRKAILSEELQWWSKERKEYEIKIHLDIWDSAKPTPPPEPPEDLTEYPRLAAYAYYRIMLLHLAQGQEAEAASTYQTLQETFGANPYAAPYVEMASAFWEAYQPTQKMYDGCAAAIQYAVEHPEILIPLGSEYHGWQSHVYEPADVCPFR